MKKTSAIPIVRLVLLFLVTAAIACSPLSLLPNLNQDSAVDGGGLSITQTRLSILESFPVQVQLNIEGQLPDACTSVSQVSSSRSGNTFTVTVQTERLEAECPVGPVPFEEQIQLDVLGLPAGEYEVVVEGVSQSFTLSVDNVLTDEMELEENRVDVGQGFSLVVPDSVGGQAVLNSVPSQAGEDNPMVFANYPDRWEISFPNYPLSDTFHRPRIELFPLQASIEMNEAAASVVSELQALIQDQPQPLPDPLPFLPIFNAGPMVQAQEFLLSSQTVAGVRYLTQFGQALYPVNNHDLFYTYQAITADQSYYVLAILPLQHPELPANGDDFLGMDPQDFYDNADSYFAEIETMLNEQTPGSFTPALDGLDEMMLSIQSE